MDYLSYTIFFYVNEDKVSSEELETFASEIESDLKVTRPWEIPKLDMKTLPTVVPDKPNACEEHRVLCLRCDIFLSLIQEGHDKMGVLAANILLGSVVDNRRDLIESASIYIKFHRVASDPFLIIPRTITPAARRL